MGIEEVARLYGVRRSPWVTHVSDRSCPVSVPAQEMMEYVVDRMPRTRRAFILRPWLPLELARTHIMHSVR